MRRHSTEFGRPSGFIPNKTGKIPQDFKLSDKVQSRRLDDNNPGEKGR